MANLTKALFNELVRVREGAKTRYMPVGEAIIRLLVGKAGHDDGGKRASNSRKRASTNRSSLPT